MLVVAGDSSLLCTAKGLEIVLSGSGDVSSNSSQDSSVASADFGSLAGSSAFSLRSVIAFDP